MVFCFALAADKLTLRVMWHESDTTDEIEGEWEVKLTHAELELEEEVVGKVVRVAWPGAEVVHWEVRCANNGSGRCLLQS